jgi:hypothetical protein
VVVFGAYRRTREFFTRILKVCLLKVVQKLYATECVSCGCSLEVTPTSTTWCGNCVGEVPKYFRECTSCGCRVGKSPVPVVCGSCEEEREAEQLLCRHRCGDVALPGEDSCGQYKCWVRR